MTDIEKNLERDLRKLYEQTRTEVYDPKRFLQMLNKYGPVNTVEKILSSNEYINEGVKRLYMHRRLDLSIEFFVLENKKYSDLFSEKAKKEAQKRYNELTQGII